jgi:hypothetical protein
MEWSKYSDPAVANSHAPGALTRSEQANSFRQVKKKWQSTERLLRKVPSLSEHERILFARSLSATPDERWAMHQAHLRSLGLLTRSQRQAFGFNSPE